MDNHWHQLMTDIDSLLLSWKRKKELVFDKKTDRRTEFRLIISITTLLQWTIIDNLMTDIDYLLLPWKRKKELLFDKKTDRWTDHSLIGNNDSAVMDNH